MSCEKHKKEIAGISDMKVLAEMIGDLHYETLSELLISLEKKFKRDSRADWSDGRVQLSIKLKGIHDGIKIARIYAQEAWQISKPFMLNKEQGVQECDATDDDSSNEAGTQNSNSEEFKSRLSQNENLMNKMGREGEI